MLPCMVIFFKILTIHMCVCVSVCGYVHVSSDDYGGQKRASDLQEMELEEVRRPPRVLGTELESSVKAVCVLTQ